jgi:hypothetical protein
MLRRVKRKMAENVRGAPLGGDKLYDFAESFRGRPVNVPAANPPIR